MLFFRSASNFAHFILQNDSNFNATNKMSHPNLSNVEKTFVSHGFKKKQIVLHVSIILKMKYFDQFTQNVWIKPTREKLRNVFQIREDNVWKIKYSQLKHHMAKYPAKRWTIPFDVQWIVVSFILS